MTAMLRRVETMVVALLILLAVGFLVTIRMSLLVYSPSPSVGHQLFYRVFRAPTVDDFVVFCAPESASRLLRDHGYPPHPFCPDRGVRLVKRVDAAAGGEVFVRGSHPRSADSRIFGWIPLAQVLTVVPLDARKGPEGEDGETL